MRSYYLKRTFIRFIVPLFLVLSFFSLVVSLKRQKDISRSQAANALVPVPSEFNPVQTHLFFFARDNEAYVGRRFFGTKGNANSSDRKFMKAWSGPYDCVSSSERQLLYQFYNGWDDQPGRIQEWEKWRRDPIDVLTQIRWGGPVDRSSPPYWPCSFMNSYQPINTTPAPFRYNCETGTPVAGSPWPVLKTGQTIAVSKTSSNANTCSPDGDSARFEYVTVASRDNFDLPYSQKRRDMCYRFIAPAWGRNANAYNICLDAPYVGRFDQRYALFESGPGWRLGCEPLIYAYGYPESAQTFKAFRNGELRWMDYTNLSTGSTYRPYNDEAFWQNGCDTIWYGKIDQSRGGWIYGGEYQVGQNFYVDFGDANTPPQNVSRYSPNPTPIPSSQTSTWTEAQCAFTGEEWCAAGTSCDTGWVGGPTVEVTCPEGTKLQNTGTYSVRWDGLKRFSGSTRCVSDTGCPISPTNTPIPSPTPTSCNVPQVPSGLLPSGTTTCGITTQTFTWNPVPGATGYALRIDDTSNPWTGTCSPINPGDTCVDNLTANSYTRSVIPGRTYRWWVHAINTCGWTQPVATTITIPVCTTITNTPTPSPSRTPTPTKLPTVTLSPTKSPTPTKVPTNTFIPTSTFTPTPPSIPGDGSGDGKVDGIDFVIWLNNYNQNVFGPSKGDFNNDGKVDGIDYSIWLFNYGRY